MRKKALLVFCAAAFAFAACCTQAQTFTVLHTFTCGTDGSSPQGTLIRDREGYLYGTTWRGGDLTCDQTPFGCGVVFKFDKNGNETVLHNFGGGPLDGAGPMSGLIRDDEGNFYGTTDGGGPSEFGTVFELDKSSNETVLYSFTGGADEGRPVARLAQDAKGNLYGTAYDTNSGHGTVFEVDKDGKFTTLYTFTAGEDGGYPAAGLTLDKEGNLYGTASLGGDLSCNNPWGCGTVFKLEPSGEINVLHTFTGPPHGAIPFADLTFDRKGNFLSSTVSGGFPYGLYTCGTIFRMDRRGKVTNLYKFHGRDGMNPTSPLVEDAEGNLYGTTEWGGNTYGTIFKLDKNGKETVLHNFTSGADGGNPTGGLVLDPEGNLYGTTPQWGANGCGVLFKITKGQK